MLTPSLKILLSVHCLFFVVFEGLPLFSLFFCGSYSYTKFCLCCKKAEGVTKSNEKSPKLWQARQKSEIKQAVKSLSDPC